MNLTAWTLLGTLIPLLFDHLGRKSSITAIPSFNSEVGLVNTNLTGAEKLDHSRLIGGVIVLFSIYNVVMSEQSGFSFINLDYINFVVLLNIEWVTLKY